MVILTLIQCGEFMQRYTCTHIHMYVFLIWKVLVLDFSLGGEKCCCYQRAGSLLCLHMICLLHWPSIPTSLSFPFPFPFPFPFSLSFSFSLSLFPFPFTTKVLQQLQCGVAFARWGSCPTGYHAGKNTSPDVKNFVVLHFIHERNLRCSIKKGTGSLRFVWKKTQKWVINKNLGVVVSSSLTLCN